jgi:uridylate kinase
MRLVLRIGGSVIASPVNPELIGEYAKLVNTIKERDHEIIVVVGGGALARDLIGYAKRLGLDQEAQDEIAIAASRIFAQFLLKKIGSSACPDVSQSIRRAMRCVEEGKIAVMGGLKPGMTTDAVAAKAIEALNASLLVKATDQEGIYDKDPKRNKGAVKLDRLKFEDLTNVCTEEKHYAGIHQVIDPEAIKVLRRCKARVIVVNGFKPRNVLLAIERKDVGTLVE